MKRITVLMIVCSFFLTTLQVYAGNNKPIITKNKDLLQDQAGKLNTSMLYMADFMGMNQRMEVHNFTPSIDTSVSMKPVRPEPTRPRKVHNQYSDYGVLSSQKHDKTENNIIPPDQYNLHEEGDGEKTSCQYSSNAELASLSTNELIAYLKSTSDYDCHARILFNYESDYSPLIFTNEKIQAMAEEIENLAPAYDGTFTNGLYGLICYIYVAEYFSFYYPATISINDNSLTAIGIATDALCINPVLFDLNEEAPVILEEFLIILDFPGLRHREPTISLIKQTFANMVIYDTWKTTPDISWVLGYWRIYFLMFRGCESLI